MEPLTLRGAIKLNPFVLPRNRGIETHQQIPSKRLQKENILIFTSFLENCRPSKSSNQRQPKKKSSSSSSRYILSSDWVILLQTVCFIFAIRSQDQTVGGRRGGSGGQMGWLLFIRIILDGFAYLRLLLFWTLYSRQNKRVRGMRPLFRGENKWQNTDYLKLKACFVAFSCAGINECKD